MQTKTNRLGLNKLNEYNTNEKQKKNFVLIVLDKGKQWNQAKQESNNKRNFPEIYSAWQNDH